ncbi:unnamed protein product [Chrysoparadoxa australica]
MTSITDFETMMSLDAPIASSALPRWQRKQLQDRFIPCREAMDMQGANYKMNNDADSNILAFKNKAPEPVAMPKVLYTQKTATAKVTRSIPSAPIRVLDAPDMLDDYYLNLLSWGTNNVLAVALAQTVYLWEASTGSITELFTLEDDNDYVCSVQWIQEGGSHIAVGTASSQVMLWDAQACKQVRSMDGHSARVGALAWNKHILSSGSRDTTVINHDVRVQEHKVALLRGHTQEVCSLAWNQDGDILASGGNDNVLNLWEASVPEGRFNSTPKYQKVEHQAAVKALAWCPFEKNLLASGAGTADKCIKFWNANTGALLNSIDTGSQVCSLQWSTTAKEIVSSHGYAENEICLWSYPTMAKIKELKGHTSRVLHTAVSPDGQTIVSAAADETLRFWSVFAAPAQKKAGKISSGLKGARSLNIR